jgi:hypothetical protein
MSRAEQQAAAALMSLSLRVMLFFARNPHEELSTRDVAEKFGVYPESVRKNLRSNVDRGLLSFDMQLRSRGGIYRAGPLLLKTIGVTAQEKVEVIRTVRTIRLRERAIEIED